MSRVFLHADWHLNHQFVAETRGFDSADEHDEWLIDGINSVVTKRDHLWFLGDLTPIGSLGAALEKVKRINGIKHMVYGNHDAGHPMHKRSHTKQRRYLEVFESASLHEQLILPDKRKLLLSHLPYAGDHYGTDRHQQWRLRDEGEWLACGHVHHAWGIRGRQFNVGVDYQERPIEAGFLGEHMQVMDKTYAFLGTGM